MTQKIKNKLADMQFFRDQGLTLKAIARIVKVSPRVVKKYTVDPETKNQKTKKKLCDDCIYRTWVEDQWCCYYIVLKGERRNCDPENCNKYKQGKPLSTRLGRENGWIW